MVAGEASRGNQAAAAAEAALRAAAAQCGLDEDRVHLVGAINDVAPLLSAADVLVCASAYEGLSLAQLEALAAGLPVVATAVGGTAEIAQDNPAMRLLAPDSPPGAFAAVLAELAFLTVGRGLPRYCPLRAVMPESSSSRRLTSVFCDPNAFAKIKFTVRLSRDRSIGIFCWFFICTFAIGLLFGLHRIINPGMENTG